MVHRNFGTGWSYKKVTFLLNATKSKKEIDDGVKLISDYQGEDVTTHFIYCYTFKLFIGEIGRLEEFFLTKMKTRGIKSTLLTRLSMWRIQLVTKEKVKQAYEGKLKRERGWISYEVSINDDLEQFFIDLQNQKQIKNEKVSSFFTPKLTEKELKLVQEKNEQHLNSYVKGNPDVDPEEMKKSNSKSKYVHGTCMRKTVLLTVESDRKRAPDENASEIEMKMPKK